jgi:hypothetical protein
VDPEDSSPAEAGDRCALTGARALPPSLTSRTTRRTNPRSRFRPDSCTTDQVRVLDSTLGSTTVIVDRPSVVFLDKPTAEQDFSSACTGARPSKEDARCLTFPRCRY